MTKEITPSVEKIFTAVTTEIKPHISGKYFVQIDDDWNQQSVRKSFATLEDAVKISRIMHKELCKVSRHIYATIEARTVDISKYCFRSDDWTTFFEIDTYGNEKVLRRETIDAIAKIENRTVEEVRNDIGRCTDNYGIYKNSATVKEINAPAESQKFEVGKWYYDCCVDSDKSPAYKVTHRTKKTVTLTDVFGEIIKRKIDATRSVEEVSVSGEIMPVFLKANCFCTDTDEIQKAEDELAYSLAQDAEVEETDSVAEVEEVNAEKNPLKEKIADLKAAEKIISEKYLSLCRSLYVKIDGEYRSAFGADDYVTKYHDTFYCKEGNDYVEDTTAYRELKEIEREWNALFKELEYFENIEEKAEILKEKISEQKSRPHKGIDWTATFDDMKISEILSLQKDFKKFLKLGQTDLAENIFSMLKTLCRDYHSQFAA